MWIAIEAHNVQHCRCKLQLSGKRQPKTVIMLNGSIDVSKAFDWGWPTHKYLLGTLFLLLALLVAVLWFQGIRHKRRTILTGISLLLITLGLSQGIALIFDPYGTNDSFPKIVNALLVCLAFPCLTSTYVFLVINAGYIIQAHLSIVPLLLQKDYILVGIVLVHFAVAFTVDVATAYYRDQVGRIRLFCHTLFVGWACFMFFCFIYIKFKLSFYIEQSQHILHQLTVYSQNGQQKQVPRLEITDGMLISEDTRSTSVESFYAESDQSELETPCSLELKPLSVNETESYATSQPEPRFIHMANDHDTSDEFFVEDEYVPPNIEIFTIDHDDHFVSLQKDVHHASCEGSYPVGEPGKKSKKQDTSNRANSYYDDLTSAKLENMISMGRSICTVERQGENDKPKGNKCSLSTSRQRSYSQADDPSSVEFSHSLKTTSSSFPSILKRSTASYQLSSPSLHDELHFKANNNICTYCMNVKEDGSETHASLHKNDTNIFRCKSCSSTESRISDAGMSIDLQEKNACPTCKINNPLTELSLNFVSFEANKMGLRGEDTSPNAKERYDGVETMVTKASSVHDRKFLSFNDLSLVQNNEDTLLKTSAVNNDSVNAIDWLDLNLRNIHTMRKNESNEFNGLVSNSVLAKCQSDISERKDYICVKNKQTSRMKNTPDATVPSPTPFNLGNDNILHEHFRGIDQTVTATKAAMATNSEVAMSGGETNDQLCSNLNTDQKYVSKDQSPHHDKVADILTQKNSNGLEEIETRNDCNLMHTKEEASSLTNYHQSPNNTCLPHKNVYDEPVIEFKVPNKGGYKKGLQNPGFEFEHNASQNKFNRDRDPFKEYKTAVHDDSGEVNSGFLLESLPIPGPSGVRLPVIPDTKQQCSKKSVLKNRGVRNLLKRNEQNTKEIRECPTSDSQLNTIQSKQRKDFSLDLEPHIESEIGQNNELDIGDDYSTHHKTKLHPKIITTSTSSGAEQIRHSKVLKRTMSVLCVCTALGFLNCVFQMYDLFGLHDEIRASSEVNTEPWVWFVFQTLFRWVWTLH